MTTVITSVCDGVHLFVISVTCSLCCEKHVRLSKKKNWRGGEGPSPGPPCTKDRFPRDPVPGGFGAAGASHDSPRTPNVNISGPWRFKHHQNSTRRPQERRKKENCGGRGKKRDILAPHPSGPHPLGPTPPFFWVRPPSPLRAPLNVLSLSPTPFPPLLLPQLYHNHYLNNYCNFYYHCSQNLPE